MLRQIFSLSLLLVLLIGGAATAQRALEVRTMQIQLQALGFEVGSTDGVSGPRTHDAVIAFQRAFGLAETGSLSIQGADLLKRSSGIAAQSSRVAVAARRLNRPPEHVFMTGNPDVPEIYYANGAHFVAVLQRWNGHPDQIQARFSVARNLAAEQSDYDAALVDLDMWAFDIVDYSSKTLPAIETLIAEARRQPNDVTHLNTVLRKIGGRFVEDLPGECRVPDVAARTSNAIEILLELHVARGGGPDVGGNLSGLLAVCLEGNSAMLVHDRRIEFASMIAPSIAALAHHDKALVAHAIGDYDAAREHFEQMLQLDELAGPEETKMTFGLDTIERLHAVGLADDARKLATGVVNAILASPRDRFARITIMGDSDREFLQAVSAMLLAIGETALLERLAAHVVLSANAISLQEMGISYLMDTEHWEAGAAAAARVAERLIAQGLDSEAIAVMLQEVEARLQLGDYRSAEQVLSTAQNLAGSSVTSETRSTIAALNARLGLLPQESIEPALAAVENIQRYLGRSCVGNLIDGRTTGIDYSGFEPGSAFTRTVLEHGVLEALGACRIDSWQLDWVARAYCGLAAAAGRRDIVAAYLDAQFDVPRFSPGNNGVEACAFGLADAGTTEWLYQYGPVIASLRTVPLLEIMATTPADRLARARDLYAQFEATRQPDGRNPNYDIINRLALMNDVPDGVRREAVTAVVRSFVINNSGMSARAYEYDALLEDAFQTALGYHRLGLSGLAEAYLAVNEAVDPAWFGIASDEDLDRILFDWDDLRWRLLHGQVAHAKGDLVAAEQAIEPVVRAALRHLSDPHVALAGTIEQWSERLEGYFALYITLQHYRPADARDATGLFLAQQVLHAAGSTVNLTALEQRQRSLSPDLAREYQDALRGLRIALRNRTGPDAISARAAHLRDVETRLPQDDAAAQLQQIGVLLPLAQAQSDLPGGAALVVATQLPDGVALAYVTSYAIRTHWLEWTPSEARARIASFRRGLDPSTPDSPFDASEARQLHASLFDWTDEEPPAELRLVIDGPIAALPFGALLMDAGVEDWLGRRVALSYAPSVARAVKADPTADETDGHEPFLGFGDPILDDRAHEAWTSLLGEEAQLTMLPETRDELVNMAIQFGGDPMSAVHIGAGATEAKLSALNASGELKDARILAFATHGLLGRRLSGSLMSPAIVLTPPEVSSTEDGLLTASEVFDLNLDADLVILAACDTGAPEADRGVSELASAFFYAGAQSLLMTHYKADTGASLEITRVLSTRMGAEGGSNAAEALRLAIDTLLSNEHHASLHAPRRWASYFVMR